MKNIDVMAAAIRGLRPVSFLYGSLLRECHPLFLVEANGKVYLEAIQVGGATSAGASLPVFRRFFAINITDIRVDETVRFAPVRCSRDRGGKVIAKAAPIDDSYGPRSNSFCSQPKRGKFIIIEGIDGSGKSTLSARLVEGIGGAVLTSEPTIGPLGVAARLIRDDKIAAILFDLDRRQHIEEFIEPALQRGEHVVCDRYFWSMLANQGIDVDTRRLTCGVLLPDLIVLLDVSPSTALGRLVSRDGTSDSLPTLAGRRARYMQCVNEYRTCPVIVLDERSVGLAIPLVRAFLGGEDE